MSLTTLIYCSKCGIWYFSCLGFNGWCQDQSLHPWHVGKDNLANKRYRSLEGNSSMLDVVHLERKECSMLEGLEYSVKKLKHLVPRTLYEWMKALNPRSS